MEIQEHGNVADSVNEAIERFGLKCDKVHKDINILHKEFNIQPICVLCDMDYVVCTQRKTWDPHYEKWRCEGFTMSKKTIEKYRDDS